jgi:Uma2 family endonuclease
MTLTEYFDTPETVLPQELAYGIWHVAEAPSASHQRVVLKLAMALEAHAGPRGLGEVFIAPIDVVLDADRALVVQPDLLFVANDRSGLVIDRIYGAPDLVVEVLSPDPRVGRLEERVGWFAKYGVREVWLYEQSERRLDLLRCEGGRVVARRRFERWDRIQSDVLPDFDRTMAAILG